MPMLTDDQLRRVWNRYLEQQAPEKGAWYANYARALKLVQAIDAETIRTPQSQQLLWNSREVRDAIGAGPGDSVNTAKAMADARVLNGLAALRSLSLGSDGASRAQRLQQEYNAILDAVVAAGTKPVPRAKLQRVFTLMFPDDFTVVLNAKGQQHLAELLLGPEIAGGMISKQVLVRMRLREILGPEQDDRDRVVRAIFGWHLADRFESFSRGEFDGPSKTDASPTPAADPPLSLQPFGAQFKGNPLCHKLVEGYRDIVQSCLSGATTDEIVTDLQSDESYQKASVVRLRATILRVLGLGLIGREGVLFKPTSDGRELLDDPQSDILVQRMLERVYGFAQVLRNLAASDALTVSELTSRLQAEYPQWTTPVAPSALRTWCVSLGLATQSELRVSLTDYGRSWLARLPKDLPAPNPDDLQTDVESSLESDGVTTVSPASVDMPTLAVIRANIRAAAPQLVIDETQFRTLDAAWRFHDKKRFVLLSGLSGTGKTVIVQQYARAVCRALSVPEDQHLAIVAVSPDWRDPSGLLGYFNALHADPTFQPEPALRLMMRAVENPSRPYFLVLDEMNLARVERYFAPLLSAMESGDCIALHAETRAVNGVPPKLPWPRNLFIAGTVNMDESTYAFSDKVLDRGFTLEFWDVDLRAFFDARDARDRKAEDCLVALQETLRPIRRHFGYRTAGEVIDFVIQMSRQEEPMTPAAALDVAIFSKVLPRLRGEDSAPLREALAQLRRIARDHELARCALKLSQLEAAMQHSGILKFWA